MIGEKLPSLRRPHGSARFTNRCSESEGESPANNNSDNGVLIGNAWQSSSVCLLMEPGASLGRRKIWTSTFSLRISFLRGEWWCLFRPIWKVGLFLIFSGPLGSLWPLFFLSSCCLRGFRIPVIIRIHAMWKWDSTAWERLVQCRLGNRSGSLSSSGCGSGVTASPLSCCVPQSSVPLRSLPLLPPAPNPGQMEHVCTVSDGSVFWLEC